MKKHFSTYVLVSLVGLFLACNEPIDVQPDSSQEYFPLEIGQYRTYAIQEIVVVGAEPDTSNYFLKEVIEDSIMTSSVTSYLVYRYKASDTLAGWDLDSIWTARRTEKQGVVTENNIPFIKLTFPVKTGIEWDGNALNSFSENTYYYDDPGELQLDEIEFDREESIKVVIKDIPANLVEQDQRYEWYVKGIGLIQKDYISVAFCQPGSGCEEVGIVDDGRILKQYLIAYGEEK